ncbi:MAG: TIM barrel protein [Candidatus Mycalebacterium zealandia]|nr:MAG: TIM barrel protein [Candidatus Mycalebacterium zealandia]
MKLGCTSYVYPADIVSNVEKLADLVDDVELLIFEGADEDSLPSAEEIDRLGELSGSGGFSYTVHLPLDIDVCSKDRSFRSFSLRRAAQIADLTSPLKPYGYVLHLPGGETAEAGWTDAACAAGSEIFAACGGNLFVENLSSYSFNRLEPVFERSPVRLCLDIAHAHKAGDDWREIYLALRDKTGIVHFYMHDPDSDRHLGFQDAPPGFVPGVTGVLLSSGYEGVLTIEMFGQEDFFLSKKIVDSEIERWGKR